MRNLFQDLEATALLLARDRIAVIPSTTQQGPETMRLPFHEPISKDEAAALLLHLEDRWDISMQLEEDHMAIRITCQMMDIPEIWHWWTNLEFQ